MKPPESCKLLSCGLLSRDLESIDEGTFWDTFLVDNVVIQAPRTGDEFRVGKNSYLYERLSEHVEVPEIVYSTENPPAFAVYERLEGITLAEAEKELSKEEYLKSVENAGRTLAQIHSIEAKGYGHPSTEHGYEKGSSSTWIDFVQETQQDIGDFVRDEPFKSVVERANAYFDPDELSGKPESCILHNDYRKENIIVDDCLNAQIIDLDNAYYGDPRFGLVRSEGLVGGDDLDAWKSFRYGYGSIKDLDMPDKIHKNYTAFAILHSAASGQRNINTSNAEKWAEGLHKWIDNMLEPENTP